MIDWFARNTVAANFLLLTIVCIGVYNTVYDIPLEVFPETELEQVSIQVSQRAATPEDMETGVTTRIEEAVADLPYIDELTSSSFEQGSAITVLLDPGTDTQKALNEVKSRIDALSTLPENAERPVIEVPIMSAEVLSLVIYGEIDETEMAAIARRVRDDLVRYDGISQASVEGIRPYQISIEVQQDTLRSFGLTLDDVARAIDSQAIDLSAGQLRSASGDILLRSKNQAYDFNDYDKIVVRRYQDGSFITLGQIANIDDGFDENPIVTRFNGHHAAIVDVYRVGKESAISVSDAVQDYLKTELQRYPDSVKFAIWDDDSRIVRERLSTLISSGWQGAILISLLLALFLHPTVALWVVVGIPVCFAGALIFFPAMGITLNVISLFSFIMVLGVVVDDAIVTGENIYSHRSRGASGIDAAIKGTHEVAVPVVFGIVTTMLAFVPMLLLTGTSAAFGQNIGGPVIVTLAFSLIESKLILPAHLSKLNIHSSSKNPLVMKLDALRDKVSGGLDYFLQHGYKPALSVCLKHRYVTLLGFIGLFVVVMSFSAFGWIRFTFFPIVNSEQATAVVRFPAGTPLTVTSAAIDRLETAAFEMRDHYTDEDGNSLIDNVISTLGSQGSSGPNSRGQVSVGSSNKGRVKFEVNQERIGDSELSIEDLVNEWRQRVGVIVGAEQVNYYAKLFRAGSPVSVQLYGHDVAVLEEVAAKITTFLANYDGVYDIEDSLQDGKAELQIKLKPEAELLGMDLQNITLQVRNAFFGVEAQRIQRGQDDVRVMVLYPKGERENLGHLEELLITTPNGNEARFGDIATVEWGRSPSTISRKNQLRTATVNAEIDREKVIQGVLTSEVSTFVGELLQQYPDITYNMAGEAEQQQEASGTLFAGLLGLLLGIFALLSVAFKSYTQPIIIMSVIPFALIGAILGHVLTNVGLSMFSIFGILALVGVVVNDSLVLVDWINRRLEQGDDINVLVNAAGAARFRAVLLTSLTTFFGLLPILLQTSVGAQFLIPMATSLAFGILFATMITLILVPCNYLMLRDLQNLKHKWFSDKPISSNTAI